MSTIHPTRTTPVTHHMKKTVVRAARSAPVSRISLKVTKAKTLKSEEEVVDTFDDDNDMASSFLQFCAMCEKQIVIPNNSILYCSESCRRKDACIHDNDPTLSLPFLNRVPISPTYGFDEAYEFGPRIILPSALPTPRPLLARIPPVAHDGKSDLDPTEWKPAEGSVRENPGGGGKPVNWRPKLPHRPSSEAYGYLAQFHRSAPAAARRGALNGRSTPSLSHTPTTAASSTGSEAGTPTEVSVGSHVSRGGTKISKRANVKSAELVTPKVASMGSTEMTSDGTENTLVGEISYDKKWVLGGKTSAAGSLKKLLGHDGVNNTALAM